MLFSTAILPLLAMTSVSATAIMSRSAQDVKIKLKDTDDCVSKVASKVNTGKFEIFLEKCADAPKWTINRDAPGNIKLAGSDQDVFDTHAYGAVIVLESPEKDKKSQQWTFHDDGTISEGQQGYCLTKTQNEDNLLSTDPCGDDQLMADGYKQGWEIVE
ncbi:hypothetical protein V865_008651 [Kwoniella europaea PYCC6329]|uniref:Ricin B lectin domain-containing protein n=1 Tax=Kwoniella europaea PYCC6329 TaxID=1423913 RepID=A0AAX4KYD5_9TREE